MPSHILTSEKKQEINMLLDKAAEVRKELLRGQLAGIITQATIDAHDAQVDKLKRIKQQFIDAP